MRHANAQDEAEHVMAEARWLSTGAFSYNAARRVAAAFVKQADVVREAAACAAETARLPTGYQWGEDAMEAFRAGTRAAAAAVRSLK